MATTTATSPGLAFVFPGQGSQEVGMGRALYEAYPEARAVFQEADAALGGPTPFSRLVFEGPASDLTLTANTQPAILVTSVAVWRVVASRLGVGPSLVAGHSLGEYSALVAAGALGLADAVRLTRARGGYMQDAVAPGEGAMAAMLGLEPALVGALCDEAAESEVVSPANYNAPGQVVVAGHAAAVGRVVALAGARGGKGIPLKVSAPFHCALMQPAADRLATDLARITFAPLRVPVVTNVEAHANADPARVAALLVRQVASPVRWEESIRWMIERGVTTFVELGPGRVLGGLIKRIDKRVELLSAADPEGVDRVVTALTGSPAVVPAGAAGSVG